MFEEGKVFERRAEVMAPFTNTVGFVDGDAGELAMRVDDAEDAAEVV